MPTRVAAQYQDQHHRNIFSERFIFCLFLSAVAHAAIVLGLSFDSHKAQGRAPVTLEVTLTRTKAAQAVAKADFLAQEDQEGSGTLEQAQLMTTTEIAEFQDINIALVTPMEREASAPPPSQAHTSVITASQAESFNMPEEPLKDEQPQVNNIGQRQSLLKRSLEIASLEAKFDSQRQAYAKRPRIHRLTAVSTVKAEDASYVHKWLRKIEHIGNLNYPEEAKRKQIYGHLRMLVAIKPDGQLHALEVLESSGYTVLDDAAKRIVRLAAPFAPFSTAMRQKFDLLEIIRTWEFKRNYSLSSY